MINQNFSEQNNQKAIYFAMIAGAIVAILLVFNEYRIMSIDGANYNKLERLQFWLSAICSLGIYTFLYKENVVYRAFEHAMLGCALGMGTALMVRQQIWQKWLDPMTTAFGKIFTNGISVTFTPEVISGLILIIPGIIGLLWYFQYSKKYFWISRIAFCVTLGAGTGLGFKDKFNQLLPQVTETCKPLWVGPSIIRDENVLETFGNVALGRILLSAQNLIFISATIAVLVYFFFVVSRKKVYINGPAQLGRWYLMIALGAFFGNTFMTRLSALIERANFLIIEWLRFQSLS